MWKGRKGKNRTLKAEAGESGTIDGIVEADDVELRRKEEVCL